MSRPDDSPGESSPGPPAVQGQTSRPRLGRLGPGVVRRFVLFAALTLAIMVLVILYATWRLVRDAQTLQTHVARWAADSLDGWLLELDTTLVTGASVTTLMDVSRADVLAYLSNIRDRSPSFRSVTLADAREGHRGEEVLTLSGAITTTGAQFGQEEWFIETLRQGHYVSPIRFVQGIPILTLSYAIYKEEKPLGVIAAEVDPSSVYPIITRARTDRGGYAYVVDDSGLLILHETSDLVSAQQSGTEIEGVRTAIKRQQMPLYYKGWNGSGDLVIGAYVLMTRAPWIVIAEQPLPQILGDFLPLIYAAAGAFLLSAVAAFVVGAYLSRRVAAPIVLLREGAQRIGTGDLEHRIVLSGRNELADLAEEFNHMAANLRESQTHQEAWSHELEARVAERTSELSQTLQQLQQETAARESLLRTVQEMSSPVIPVMEGIIVMPIVGTLDSARAGQVIDDLLAGIEQGRARVAIMDITGLAVVDTAVANAILHAAQAAQLLGAQPILVGIAPEVAETLVQLGVEIQGVRTAATLQEGLRAALALLHRKVIPL